MIQKINQPLASYQSELLSNHTDILHFFSTRENGADKIEELSELLTIPLDNIVITQQTHGANVRIITPANKAEIHVDTDALATKHRGICITIKTADCTPVLLFDPKQKAVAAIHSGWRGTVQNIAEKTINVLKQQFHSKPENIIAAIGPSIGQENYEVGPEVVEQFQKLFPVVSSVLDFSGCPVGKAKLNVRHALLQQLLNAGLNLLNIDMTNLCTFNEASVFYSARREGANTGRMINGILLK